MPELHSILIAALAGFGTGFVASIPVGPVNLTILNEGARRGFFGPLLIGLGATAMEVIYCFIAFTGFASVFENEYIRAGMELLSFVFLLFLGSRFLFAKTLRVNLGAAADILEAGVGKRLHPRSAFMTGLVQVMGNLGVLVFWIVLAAHFISAGWVTPDWSGRLSCVAGVALGVGGWFVGLSWAASLGYGKFSEKTLLRMEHLSGVCLIILALIHGSTMAWQMAHHRLHHHG